MSGVVVPWPGKPIVCVRSEPGNHAILLAKPGSTYASLQCSYDTLEDADREAREGAELCGWKYIGVFDADRLRHLDEIHEQRPFSRRRAPPINPPNGGDAA